MRNIPLPLLLGLFENFVQNQNTVYLLYIMMIIDN